MSVTIDKLVGPLAVAGILALVGFAWRISLQVEQMEGRVTSLQYDIIRNRQVSCSLAREQKIVVADCPEWGR